MAESFGTDPQRYDRIRPRYPTEMIERVVAAIPGADILDVGCGTGIAARQLQAAGCTVLGVDVDSRVAAYASDRGLEVEVAAFESWDRAGRTFAAVVSAQTWHWIDPVIGATRAAEALRPLGRIVLIWNVFEPPSALAEDFAAVYRRLVPDLPMLHRPVTATDAYTTNLEKAADGIRRSQAFDEPAHWTHEWERSYTRDDYLDFQASSGVWAALAPSARQQVQQEIGTVIDGAGGGFTMRYVTVALTAVHAP